MNQHMPSHPSKQIDLLFQMQASMQKFGSISSQNFELSLRRFACLGVSVGVKQFDVVCDTDIRKKAAVDAANNAATKRH